MRGWREGCIKRAPAEVFEVGGWYAELLLMEISIEDSVDTVGGGSAWDGSRPRKG